MFIYVGYCNNNNINNKRIIIGYQFEKKEVELVILRVAREKKNALLHHRPLQYSDPQPTSLVKTPCSIRGHAST